MVQRLRGKVFHAEEVANAESPSRNEMMYFRNREETQVPREDRVKERKIEDEVGDVGRGQMGEI